ncbi:hypothetical protein H7J88_17105 [Mycolicibacterium flavescens]|uniref:RapA2 cadherin-like domain-containing protein n=1 Tax=Mycolicibacterium flavescens TaxID=1776 RepID=A0A1E3RML4_MYCFV|nr:Ig-like domain-containing protein [Mycolicibacterium flavescens]MCV7281358.1 hypothetical protein [Mycolicibacterium flavescens]ODQ91135.1 hypothetical protein BHQ18_06990 [Mycolicibacterium flavescens]
MATYVGRVGALAVALGVGIAVTGSPGVACADTATTSPSSDSPTPANIGDTSAETDVSIGDVDESTSGSPVEQSPGAAEENGSTTPPSTQETTELPNGVTISSSGGAHTSGESDETDEDEPDPEPEQELSAPAPTVTAPVERNRSKQSTAAVASPAQNRAATESTATRSSARGAQPSDSAPVSETLGAAETTTASVDVPTPLVAERHAQVLTAVPNPIAGLVAIPVGIVSAVVQTLLSPFISPGGPGPAQPPLLWAVLGWIRREIQTTFFNRRPVLAAPTDVEQVDRAVTGVVVGSDPDDDALTYTVPSTSAGGGTVTIDDQGEFTYMAPETWDGTSLLTDSFTVTVSDRGNGWHVHGLAGLFGGKHTTTREISIALVPTTTEPTATAVGEVTVPTTSASSAQGSDGTFAVTYRTGSGTSADPYRTTITVVRPGRDPVTADVLGSIRGSVNVLSDGTAVVTTTSGSGSEVDPSMVTFTVMRPGTATETSTTAGTAAIAVSNTRGTAVAGINYIPVNGGFQMSLRVARVGEAPIVIAIDELPQFFPPAVTPDGTVVFTTSLEDAEGRKTSRTVHVLRPGSAVVEKYAFAEDGPSRLVGEPVVGGDGTVAFATTSGSGAAGDPFVTTVTVLHPKQDPVTSNAFGTSSGIAVGKDGTVSYATGSDGGVTVTVLRAGHGAVVSTADGALYGTQIGDDGTVAYQTYTGSGSSADPYQLTVTVLRPGQGPVVARTTAGFLNPLLMSPDGTVVLNALTGPSGGWYREYVVLRSGADPVSIPITDVPGSTAAIGADGTFAVVTSRGVGTVEDPTRTEIIVLRPGQVNPTPYSAPGSPRGAPIVGADGTVAVVAQIGSTASAFTVVRPGQEAQTYPGAGIPQSPATIGPGGVLYQLLESNPRGSATLLVVEPSGESTALPFTGTISGFTVHRTGGATLLMSVTDAETATTTVTSYEITTGPYRPSSL